MWNFAVLVFLVAVAGSYAARNMQALERADAGLAAATAAEMAIYREAVVGYFEQHDLRSTAVATSTLKSGGHLPSWSRMYQQATPLAWGNYRDAHGVIYVYGTSLPARNLSAELARLAHNSVLVGVYRSGAATLQSPVTGATHIPVTALAGMAIPDGAPLWVAMRH